MVDINDIYKQNSDYLKAEDLGNNMPTFSVTHADVKDFENGDRKLVLAFHETEKSLPLNVTNARTMADMFGPDSDNWVNQKVMVFSMDVDFSGKMVKGIRLRAPQGQGDQEQSGQTQNNQSQGNSYAKATGAEKNFDERNPPPQERNY